MNKLEKIQFKIALTERLKEKNKSQILSALKKENVSYSSYRRWENENLEEDLKQELAWRTLVKKSYYQGIPFLELRDKLKEAGYKPSQKDLRAFLKKENLQGQRGRVPKSIQREDLSILEYLSRANEYNDQLIPMPELDTYKIRRIVSLGYLYPYQPKEGHLPLRFRMDAIFLEGKWRDLDGNLTPQPREKTGGLARIHAYKKPSESEWKLKFREESIGHPDTHKSGIILIMLNPCLFEAKKYTHNPHPTTKIPIFTSKKWHSDKLKYYQHTLPVPYIGKDVFSFSFGRWTPCSNFKFTYLKDKLKRIAIEDILDEDSPFSPQNLKDTLEKNLEDIITTRTRAIDLREKYKDVKSLEQLDLEWHLEDMRLYLEKFVNSRRRKLVQFPNDWFQLWYEAKEYKIQTKKHQRLKPDGIAQRFNSEVGFPKDKDQKLENTKVFHQYLNNYKVRGISPKVLPLSLFGTFANEENIMLQLAIMLDTVDYLPVYFQKMKEIRDIHYPDFEMPLFEPAISFKQKEQEDYCGFSRCTVKINKKEDVMLFFALGAYPYWIEEDDFEDGAFLDLYGKTIDLTKEQAEESKFELIEELLSNLGEYRNLVTLCIENGEPVFEYICYNSAYWSEEEQDKLFDYDPENFPRSAEETNPNQGN